MELIPQNGFPAVMHTLCLIRSAGKAGKHGKPFQLSQGIFHLPVIALVAGLGGIGSPVVFQVELPVPKGYIAIRFLHVFMDFFKKFLGICGFNIRHAGDTVNRPDIFNHASRGSAASVSVSVGNENLPAQIFIFKFTPGADNGFGSDFSIVGRASARYRHAGGRYVHKICQHFRPVDPAPPEQVVGYGIILVPADFRCHKGIQAAQLHNLRERPAVAEHVRQPQKMAFFAEFFFDKADPVQELAGKAFPGGHVAVRFQPHAAVRLPAAFLYTLLNALIYFRAVFFQKFI